MKIYVHGRDHAGSSIETDRGNIINILKDMNHKIVDNYIFADALHSVWWDRLLPMKYYPIRFKKRIIATASNFIYPDENNNYKKLKKIVSLWIAPSKKQYDLLKRDGVNVEYVPFYVDSSIFKKENKSKKELVEELGIDYKLIENKILFGSFQRDTWGKDLITPKWQKNPELLVNIFRNMPKKDGWLVMLAGPRRHYIIREFEKYGIPYYYYGKKPEDGIDDIQINNINPIKMNKLYNLIDCYVVSSKLEGGPKSVIESSLCKTYILSTDVGLAPDILDKSCIANDEEGLKGRIIWFINNMKSDSIEHVRSDNLCRVNMLCSKETIMKSFKKIYEPI